MGDLVMASGLIASLRRLWPTVHLAWLAEEGLHTLLSHHPDLDKVYALPYRRWKGELKAGRWASVFREGRAFRDQLKDGAFDLAIDLQGLMKSGIWTLASGAPLRIGLGSREGSQRFMHHVVPRDQEDARMGKEYRRLARWLGASEEDFRPGIPAPPLSETASSPLAEARARGKALALFAPFTTRPQKHWFDARWVELARALAPAYHCVILGGREERAHAEALVRESQGGLHHLAGQTTLLDCAALIREADLLIGVDTGLTHLAMAQGTPTLALFGSTRPYWEPPHPRARILYQPEPCSPCHRHPVCGNTFRCMAHHTVSDLVSAVAEITKSDEPVRL